MRQISVLVTGAVNNPGQRLVTGLSSVLDAILISGGVSKTGSLRDVRISRGGHQYNVDLYGVLAGSGSSSTLRLADGDRIFVAPLGRTVAVAGLVRNPGIYELPKGQSSISAQALLALAGGQEVSGKYDFSLMKLQPDGQSALVPPQNLGDRISDGEILSAQLQADRTAARMTLAGGTGLAGDYPIVSGTKLSELIRRPGALGTSPYTLFGIIVRRDPKTLLRTLIAFTPAAVLNGREDMALLPDDIVRPISVNEMRMLDITARNYDRWRTAQEEAIRNPIAANNTAPQPMYGTNQPGTLQQPNVTVQPGPLSQTPTPYQQGNFLPGNDPAQLRVQSQDFSQFGPEQYGYGQRQYGQGPVGQGQLGQNQSGAPQFGGAGQGYDQSQVGPMGNAIPGAANSAQGMTTNQQNAFQSTQAGAPNGMNLPGNRSPFSPYYSPYAPYSPYVAEAPNFQAQITVPGAYPLYREVRTFNQLAQQLGVAPLVLMNFLLGDQVSIDGAVRGPGTYFVGPNVTLQDLVLAAGDTANWADASGVELISTLVDSTSGRSATRVSKLPLTATTLASYVVKPHDSFRFNEVFTDVNVGSATVQGEVRFTGNYKLTRGEHLSDLLARAGGLTNSAYPYGTVFLRKSAAALEQEGYTRTAREVEDQLVVAMTRVGNDKIDPSTFASMQSFVSDLRNQRAIGRIAISADPSVLAANPALDPLLEAGDVIYIPPRPSTISVLGQVMQPGSFPYRAGETVGDYIERAGGYSRLADDGQTFIVLPDGTARRLEKSWLRFGATDALPPGSAIVIPRDVTPLDLRQTIIDISQIMSQLAVSIASVAVLSRQ
jgi:protein involved in polysaccharide export with SLBB domain